MEKEDVKKGVDTVNKLNIWIYILVAIYFISLISISLYFNFSRFDIRIFLVALILLVPTFGIYFLIYFKSKNPEIVKLRQNPVLSKKVTNKIETEGYKRFLRAYSISFWIKIIITIIAIVFIIIIFFWYKP